MLRTLFVLAILIPWFFIAIRYRFAAVLLYVWFAAFRPQDWIWVDISSLRLSLVLGLLAFVPALLVGIWPNITHPLSLGAIAFLILSLVSQVDAVETTVGWYWIDYTARLILMCLLTTSIVNTRKRLIWMVAVIAGSYGFHSSKAGVNFLLTGSRYYDGLSGAYSDNNGYALAIVMILPLLMATAQNVTMGGWKGKWVEWSLPWIRRGALLAIPLSVGTIVATFSRGGLLGLSVCVLVYVMFQRRRMAMLTAMAAVLIPAVIWIGLPEGYLDRMQTIRTYQQVDETSAVSRLHFWEVAVAMARARPFGVGLRQYEEAYDRFDFSNGQYGEYRSVHSSHLQVLAELGYAGAAVWAGLLGYAAFAAFRIRQRAKRKNLAPDVSWFLTTYANAFLASMAGFVVGGAFIALALNDITWYVFALVAALDRLSARMCAEADQDASEATSRVTAGPILARQGAA